MHSGIQVKGCLFYINTAQSFGTATQYLCKELRRPEAFFLEQMQGSSAGAPVTHTDAEMCWTPAYVKIEDWQNLSTE